MAAVWQQSGPGSSAYSRRNPAMALRSVPWAGGRIAGPARGAVVPQGALLQTMPAQRITILLTSADDVALMPRTWSHPAHIPRQGCAAEADHPVSVRRSAPLVKVGVGRADERPLGTRRSRWVSAPRCSETRGSIGALATRSTSATCVGWSSPVAKGDGLGTVSDGQAGLVMALQLSRRSRGTCSLGVDRFGSPTGGDYLCEVPDAG